MKKNRIEMVVRKDNWIVRQTINNFSKHQNRLICVLIGKYVDLSKNEAVSASISVGEVVQALGLTDCKDNYDAVRGAVSNFGENSSVEFEVYNELGEFIEWNWLPYFTRITLSKEKDRVTFVWNPEMIPHLTNLKKNYTQYIASDYLKLKSKHSQNLYELLKSVENFEKAYYKKPRFTIEELRMHMGTGDRYKDVHDFLARCIGRAVLEINKVTDLYVERKTIYGPRRKPIAVDFEIRRKTWNMTKQESEKIDALIERGGMPGWYKDTGHAVDPNNPEDRALIEAALAQQQTLSSNAESEDGQVKKSE